MSVFDPAGESTGHEQVVFCQDPRSGLRAIIAIWSTALGPALGGTRFYPYAAEADALADVLRLSRAMAYKAACAGLDLGGGKAVILGDPATDKTEPLLRAYGRMVESLGGRYWTACDVGTVVPDMDVISRETSYVTGRSVEHGGSGDSAVLTSFGVFQAMRAAAERTWGSPSLAGRRVGVEGVGKVGRGLVGHLVADGASVVVSDVVPAAVAQVQSLHDTVEAATVEDLPGLPLDVYAPCALGGSLTPELLARLQAPVVCGAANNQLAGADVAKLFMDRGVLYVPDYVANAGGLVQVADEREGYVAERARARAALVYDTTHTVLALAEADGVPPGVAADRVAERRMADLGALRSFHLPGRRS